MRRDKPAWDWEQKSHAKKVQPATLASNRTPVMITGTFLLGEISMRATASRNPGCKCGTWRHPITIAVILLLVAPASTSAGDQAAPGRQGKLRILIDKVLSHDTRPHMTESQVQEIAAAGFNVVSPRWGGHDMALVREAAESARKYGISLMPFIRGTAYTQDPKQMMVWRNGVVGKKALYSPNCDELWEGITNSLLGHARISIEIPSVLGTFVDFENYDTHGGYGHCYPLSYDETILRQFAAAHGIDFPVLAHKDRYPWLKSIGHHDEFAAFQIDAWRQRCRKLRRQIDAINPRFQLAVYPVPGPLFVREAVLPTWSTLESPLILADASTYARPMGFLSEEISLRGNRRKILDHIAFVQKYGIPFRYLGGIDPLTEPGNPEFSGKNADMLAALTDGYWVFYEGPTHGQEDHKAMFDWFTQANRSITTGSFNLQYKKRTTPELLGPSEIKTAGKTPIILHEGVGIGLHKAIKRRGTYEPHSLESMAPSYLAQADVVILQSAVRWLDCAPSILDSLRSYVENGGSLFFTNLGWSKRTCGHQHSTLDGAPILNIHEPPVPNIFPQIAIWTAPQHETCQGRYVLGNELILTQPDAVSCNMEKGLRFTTSSPNHMVFRAGSRGRVLIKNALGDSVCVAGTHGKGKVAFSGCFYGYWAPGHPFPFGDDYERDIFFAILDWLAQKSGTASISAEE